MAAEYKSIIVERGGPVWRVILNRPERKNAHDVTMLMELSAAFDEVENNPECRCAVLTGAGDVFCAGQDIKFTGSQPSEADRENYSRYNRGTRQRIQRNHKAVVAAVNGPAIGGGAYLATSCDLIVAVDTAFLQMREILAGNHAGGQNLFTIGRARSLEMALLSRRVYAPQAEQWGLINKSVPAAEFEAAVADYANALAEMPPLAIRYTKQATNILLDSAGFTNHLDAGSAMQRYLTLSPDGQEAKRAFLEKRKPNFTGKPPKPSQPQ